MAVRGAVLGLVRDALLACFDAGEMRQFATARLNVELAHIAPASEDQAEQAWEFVRWAERNGRLGDLVRAAGLERPAATEWRRLAALVGAAEGPRGEEASGAPAHNPGARRGERGRRVDYEGGSWERRIEEKLDRLTDAVGSMNVRLTLLEDRVKGRGEPFSPHLVWVGLGLLCGLVALGAIISARLP